MSRTRKNSQLKNGQLK